MDSSVFVITSSTLASLIDRGAPRRGSSSKPSRRSTRNRSRHLQTVAPVIRKRFATSPLLKSIIAAKYNAGAHGDRLRGLRATRQHRQFLFLLRGHVERFGGASDGHTQVCIGRLYLINVFLTQDTSEHLLNRWGRNSSAGSADKSQEDLDDAVRQIVSKAKTTEKAIDIFAAAELKKPAIKYSVR